MRGVCFWVAHSCRLVQAGNMGHRCFTMPAEPYVAQQSTIGSVDMMIAISEEAPARVVTAPMA